MGVTYFTPTTDPYRIEASVLPGDPMSILLQNPRMPLLIGVTNAEVAQMTNAYTCKFLSLFFKIKKPLDMTILKIRKKI